MPAAQSATESEAGPQPYAVVAGVSMHDLLASCAAATAISTPPRERDPHLTDSARRKEAA